jgi:hypothetical protein
MYVFTLFGLTQQPARLRALGNVSGVELRCSR